MSGGIYDYICYADEETIMERRERLYDMVKDLEKFDSKKLNALNKNVITAIKNVEHAKRQLDAAMTTELRAVWKAQEWWQSNDWSKDDVYEAISEL